MTPAQHAPSRDAGREVEAWPFAPVTRAQTTPFQWRIVPSRPTAQTSRALAPHTARSVLVVPLAVADQAAPFQWKIAPAAPTAHTSALPLPQTA